eukprot:Awhi_evm1s9690
MPLKTHLQRWNKYRFSPLLVQDKKKNVKKKQWGTSKIQKTNYAKDTFVKGKEVAEAQEKFYSKNYNSSKADAEVNSERDKYNIDEEKQRSKLKEDGTTNIDVLFRGHLEEFIWNESRVKRQFVNAALLPTSEEDKDDIIDVTISSDEKTMI